MILDQIIYYSLCAVLILLSIIGYITSHQPGAGTFADLVALVFIIIVFFTLLLSFILSHLILKKWYTLSLPISFGIVVALLSSYLRAQSQFIKQQRAKQVK